MPYCIDIFVLLLDGVSILYFVIEKLFMRRIDGAEIVGLVPKRVLMEAE